jgi:hypothetical protein
MIRLRDVLQLAWNNIEWQGPNGYVLTLDMLIAMTLPEGGNTFWSPPVESVADWQANGTNDLDRAKAEEIVTTLNNTQPWA